MIISHPSGHVDTYETTDIVLLRETLDASKTHIEEHIAVIDDYITNMTESLSQPPEHIP